MCIYLINQAVFFSGLDGDTACALLQRSTRRNLINNSENGDYLGEDKDTGSKKLRLRRSAAHEHFHKVEILHPISKKPVQGAVCKHCKSTFSSRVSTNLKNHLLAKHPDAFEEVKRKDVQSSSVLILGDEENSMEVDNNVLTNEDVIKEGEDVVLTVKGTEDSIDDRGIGEAETEVVAFEEQQNSADLIVAEDELKTMNDDERSEVRRDEIEIKEESGSDPVHLLSRRKSDSNKDLDTTEAEEKKSSRKRILSSAVHEHFHKVELSHPKTMDIVFGSECKYCERKLTNRVSTNLKAHLKAKHSEVFYKVQHNDERNSALLTTRGGLDSKEDASETDEEDNKDKADETFYQDCSEVAGEEKTDSKGEATPNKRRPYRSTVHEHFDQLDVIHSKTNRHVKGSRCKYCMTEFSNRVSSNLKAHLKAKHPAALDEVLLKDNEDSNFHVVGGEVDYMKDYDEDVLSNEREVEETKANRVGGDTVLTEDINFKEESHVGEGDTDLVKDYEEGVIQSKKEVRSDSLVSDLSPVKISLRKKVEDYNCDEVSNEGETGGNLDIAKDKPLKLLWSSVHEHYDQVELPHHLTQEPVKASICKYCKGEYLTRVSTNLKNHLERKHPKAFRKVLLKDKDQSLGQKRSNRKKKSRKSIKILNDDTEEEIEDTESHGPKKSRLRYSSVHGHFDKVKISHPKTKKIIVGSCCKYCKSILSNKVSTNLKNHLQSMHPEAYDQVFSSDKMTKKKIISKKCPKNGYFKCQKCIYATNYQRSFDIHLFKDHLETTCQTCGRVFANFDEYYIHLLTHVDPIYCETCNKHLLDKTRFDYHIKMSHRDEPENGFCQTCGKYFRKVTAHHHTVHGKWSNRPKTPCPQCDYLAKSASDLRRHVRRTHGESNNLNCPWCGALTKDLTRHLSYKQCNVPEEERIVKPKYKCKYCDKEFIHRGKVRVHIEMVHEVKFKYCDKCDYKTSSIYNLRLHIKRKHEGRPLREECPVCHKMCVSVEGHMKIYHSELVNNSESFTRINE